MAVIEADVMADVDSGEDEGGESHNKLLNAVSQLYKKQRVQPPKRKEPSSQISEFHLSNEAETNAGGRIFITDLLKGLKKGTYKDIGTKVKVLQTKSKPLPKPIEKIHSDKIKRVVGYENVKKNLSRWEAIVQRNRAATQLRFPLNDSQLQINKKNDDDFISTFSTPTELEKEVDAILNSSKTAQEDKKEEEDMYPLTVEEMIEKRKMMAKIRARESFRIAKAARQNKIKSKKYHRILKRERIKQELKDFEELQKTDPEAALEKLEKIERARAEERMTLRHRNTGKWAKSQAVRAKYDTEARKQLAEQLAFSRDLTKKVIRDESGSEDGDDEAGVDLKESGANNPWVKKSESEIDAFLSGYKKYWEKKQLEEETTQPSPVEILNSYKTKSKDQLDPQENVNDTPNTQPGEEEEVTSDKNVGPLTVDNVLKKNKDEVTQFHHCETPSMEVHASSSEGGDESLDADNGTQIKEDTPKEDDDQSVTSPSKIKQNKKFTKNVIKKIPVNQFSVSSLSSEMKASEESSSEKSSGVLALNTSNKSKRGSPVKEDSEKGAMSSPFKKPFTESQFTVKPNKGGFENESKITEKRQKVRKKKRSLVNISGSWEVEEIGPKKEPHQIQKVSSPKKKKDVDINEIFDNAEYAAQMSVEQRVKRLKEDLKESAHLENDTKRVSSKDDLPGPDLSFKVPHSRSGFDEALMEISGDGIVPLQTDVRSLLKTKFKGDVEENKTPEIDPTKFLAPKPKKLNSSVPRLVEVGEESEDDDDEEAKKKAEHQINLAEAFASDDIVDEFRKEKEEERKATQPQDVDLTLPGWGSWAGYNLPVSARKRKKYLFKMPKIPRKDDRKEHVIIRDETHDKLRSHLVDELPFPFSRVKDYEATIRMPMGNTWVPQKAHKRLIAPPVVTKMGTIIKPMTEEQLFKKETGKKLVIHGQGNK